ncbi:hypothetical protein E4T52_01068 [Aureobasidium sp. EXF-3400]|nr:hypothetical protein E4T51_02895 [Aureobasidium sp. EXF-12344]KAI4784046.1 hypothetical protein E4T52_01068 [Aureobasidium sp. EXF-3400]
METERPLSILPSIKCSDCGAEIQISAMGEHMCPSQQKEDEVSPKPRSPIASPTASLLMEQQRSMLPPTKQSLNRPPSRPNRTPLPRIDPSAANKPYQARKELLSPDGSSSSGRRTPLTPLTGRPGRSPVMRSATSPSPRLPREPSQELTGNMDCAFPPFPKARSKSSARVKSPVPDAYYAPRSPMGNGGANVVRKLDNIASGPFNAAARSTSRSPSANASTRAPPAITIDQPPTERAESPIFRSASPVSYERPASPAARSPSPPQAPASPALSIASISPGGTNREGRPIPQRPVRPEPLDGFLALLKSESEAAGQQLSNMTIRSNTFPLPPAAPKSPEIGSVVRSPSAPPTRQRRPTISGASQSAPSDALPTISTTAPALPPLPTISTAMAPALPPLPSAADLKKHAHPIVHAPSDSASSASSTRSFKSDISPPVSASSSVSMLSSTLGDLSDPSLVVPSLQLRNKQTNRLSPDDAFKPGFVAPEQPVSIGERLDSPTEKMDHFPLHAPHGSPEVDFPESPVVPGFLPQRSQSSMSATSTPMASPPTEHGFSSRPTSAKRPGTSSKHICRGCSEPIQGKSVKAADGRLTGRYHKQCFVCKTCKSAFATADFYVIDNNPYCEHHYHELNNSLCAHCDRGIEGPYLETQQGQKFHPSCFTCIDCQKPLSDDYFEIAGKVYCEQHAFASVQRQEGLGPKRNMERRTTRFMVM